MSGNVEAHWQHYLSHAQVAKLLEAINPARVSHTKKGGREFANVEAYEVRAQLTRIFGFGRWSEDTLAMEPIFESINPEYRKRDKQGNEYGDPYPAVTCAYRAHVRVEVSAPDGTVLGHWSEWAAGDAQNFNITSRGDAHDFAIKTAESQAFKRAVVNLGDAFGASLYKKGSMAPLVFRTFVMPPTQTPSTGPDAGGSVAGTPAVSSGEGEQGPVDGHVDSSPPEVDPDGSQPEEPEDDSRTADASTPSRSASPPPEQESRSAAKAANADEIRGEVLALLADTATPVAKRKTALVKLAAKGSAARLMSAPVGNAAGEAVTLGALIESATKQLLSEKAA